VSTGHDRSEALREFRVWREQTWGGAAQQATGYSEHDRLMDELDQRRRARDLQDEWELRYDRRLPMPEALNAVSHDADGRGPVRQDSALTGTTAEVAAALHRQRPDLYIGVGAEMPSRWGGNGLPWGGISYGPDCQQTPVGNPRMAAEVQEWPHRRDHLFRTIG